MVFQQFGLRVERSGSLVWSLVPFLNERWCMKSRSVHEQTRPAGSTAARLGAARGGDDPKLADLHQQFALGPCHFRGPWRRARIVHVSTPLRWRPHIWCCIRGRACGAMRWSRHQVSLAGTQRTSCDLYRAGNRADHGSATKKRSQPIGSFL